MEGTSTGSSPRYNKFSVAIQNGWQKACELYLSESGLKMDSEEWKFIMETKNVSQLIEVINETWGDRSSGSTQFATSSAHASVGFRANLKIKVNKFIGIKESGRIFLQSKSTEITSTSSYIEERLQLEKQVSGKPLKGKKLVTTGIQITDQIQASIKIAVEVVSKFSDNLQGVVGLLGVVNSL